MRSRSAIAALTALTVVTVPTALVAQDHDHSGEKLGHVTFPVTCKADAPQRFERAMAVLHSFWWEAGGDAFNAVIAADSSCAMAYWGLAMNAWQNPFAGGAQGKNLTDGAKWAERAFVLGGKTKREEGFIEAVSALYRDAANTTNAQRLRAYADVMERVYKQQPYDVEVTIFYALSLVAVAPRTDTTFANQKKAAGLLNPLYAKHPDHPGLAHYIIHANDSPQLASLGLDAAKRYAGIAPSAPHAQHMPSHIFIRLGMWDETIASNWKSYDAGVAYARANQLGGVQYHEFHALDYALYGYLQQGQDKEARRVGVIADTATVVRAPSQLLGWYNRLAIKARVPLERGDWAQAAEFPVPPAEAGSVGSALAHFTRGIGAARSGALAKAAEEAASLDMIAESLQVKEPYWSRIVGIKARLVESWTMFASGDTAGGLSIAKQTADLEDVTDKHPITPGELLPARELEADMHLAAKHGAAAMAGYRATLRREPGRARAIFGLAKAAELAGDKAAAKAAYQDYLKLMAKGDGARAEIAVARKAVGK